MTSTALASLYGGKKARARKSGKALAGDVEDQEREQTVLTPPWFVQQLVMPREMFTTNPPLPVHGPYTLALDPCTTPENPTGALVRCTGTELVRVNVPPGGPDHEMQLNPFDNGLLIDWQDTVRGLDVPDPFVFVNPPYADLEAWLVKCAAEAHKGVAIHALIPFRPHREWFGTILQSSQAIIKALAPFPFVGSKSAFPAPLCLCSWNIPSPYWLGRPAAKGKWTNIILKEWQL